MAWRRRSAIVVLGAALLGACGSDDAATTGSVPAPLATTATTNVDEAAPPEPSSTAVDEDPTTDPAPDRTVGTDGSAGTEDTTLVATEVDATDEVLTVLGEPGTASSASELAEQVADAFASAGDPAAVERVDQGEPAIALVTVLVPGDDAIDGVRYRVQMTEGEPGVWRVAAATRAYVCSRATDGELCV